MALDSFALAWSTVGSSLPNMQLFKHLPSLVAAEKCVAIPQQVAHHLQTWPVATGRARRKTGLALVYLLNLELLIFSFLFVKVVSKVVSVLFHVVSKERGP